MGLGFLGEVRPLAVWRVGDWKVPARALLSSAILRGGRPRPPVAVVPVRTRSNCVRREAGWGATEENQIDRNDR